MMEPVAGAASPSGLSVPLGQPFRARLSPGEHRRLARGYQTRRALVALGFLLPNLVFFVVFLIVPILQTVLYMFETGSLTSSAGMKFVGLRNWQNIFGDHLVLQSFQNSLRYAVFVIPTVLIIGLGLALILQNIRRGGPILRAALYFPNLAPVVIAGLIWLFLVDPDFGAFNLLLRGFGMPTVTFLSNTDTALPTVASVEVWRGAGFWALFFLASLMGLPRELYEAAHLDGANAWQRFRYVTLPLMRRVILFAVVLATIYNVQIFDSVFVMTDGGPAGTTQTVVWYIYKALFSFDQLGYGAAMSFLLLLVILALSLVQMRLLRQRTGA